MIGQKGLARPYQIAYSIVFSLAVITYFVRRYLSDTDFFQLASISIIASGVLFLVHLFLKQWSVQSIVALVATGVFVYFVPHQFYTQDSIADFSTISFFLLSAAIDPDDEGFIQTILTIKLAIATLVLGAYLCQYIPDVTAVRQYETYELTRHSYGFLHPNSLGMFFVSLLFDSALLRKRISLAQVLTGACGGLLIYAVTNSRMAIILTIATVVFMLLKPLLEKVQIPGFLVIGAMLLLFFAGIYLSYSYIETNAQYQALNKLLSTRLMSAHRYIQEYGFSLYPRTLGTLQSETGRTLYNENFYIAAMQRQGIIAFSLFPILLVAQLFRRKISLYHSLLFLLCLSGAMIEEYGASILMCSPLLLNYAFVKAPAVAEELNGEEQVLSRRHRS